MGMPEFLGKKWDDTFHPSWKVYIPARLMWIFIWFGVPTIIVTLAILICYMLT